MSEEQQRTLVWADERKSTFLWADAVELIRFSMAGVVALVVNESLMQI